MCWEYDRVPWTLWSHRPCQTRLSPRLHDQEHQGDIEDKRFLWLTCISTIFEQAFIFVYKCIDQGVAMRLLLLQQAAGHPDQPQDQGDRDEVEGPAQEEDHPRVRPVQGEEDLRRWRRDGHQC